MEHCPNCDGDLKIIAAILLRSLALGASTPWNRIGCSRGRGTSAVSRCMNSGGDMTRCVMTSRQGSRALHPYIVGQLGLPGQRDRALVLQRRLG